MAQKLAADTFRSSFKVVDKEALRWFPGHMGKGLKQMQNKLRSVDCIVEVHDARIPLSGVNGNFKYTVSGLKPHILVLNKVDLINKSYIENIQKTLAMEYKNVLFTNCKDQHCPGVKQLFPLAQELIKKSERFDRREAEDNNIIIIGVPNVGKSSLVNTLRNRFLHRGNASPVGANPGITKSLMTKIKISENPLFYLFDTPGILAPNIPNTEVGLKLALCATIQDHLVGEITIADYLLYWLNKHKKFNYVKVLQLKVPSDNIFEILMQVALNHNKMLRFRDMVSGNYVRKPDLEAAAKIMIQNFRNGSLGKVMLDMDLLK